MSGEFRRCNGMSTFSLFNMLFTMEIVIVASLSFVGSYIMSAAIAHVTLKLTGQI